MATRATYQINGMTFYCHWDGYPTGAAQRFANMIAALTVAEEGDRKTIDAIEQRRGGFEYAFIRGNMDAEPTPSHDEHGDTEFRYNLRASNDGAWIEVQSVSHEWKTHKCVIRTEYRGDLKEWLDKCRVELAGKLMEYADKGAKIDAQTEALKCIPEIVRLAKKREYPMGCQGELVTYATRAQALKIEANLRTRGEQFYESNPNRKGYLGEADAWASALNPTAKAA